MAHVGVQRAASQVKKIYREINDPYILVGRNLGTYKFVAPIGC